MSARHRFAATATVLAASTFVVTVTLALTGCGSSGGTTSTRGTAPRTGAAYRGFVTPGVHGVNCAIGFAGVTCGANRPIRPYSRYVKVTLHVSGNLTRCHGLPCISNSGPVPTLAVGRSTTVGGFTCAALRAGVVCFVRTSGEGFLLNARGVQRLGRSIAAKP